MPKGHVQWFDPSEGRGVVQHAGREYAVEAREVPRDARTSGAPVHFDISHRATGDVAVNVTSRGGARTSRRAGRHGDQTGARNAADKRRTKQGRAGVLTRAEPAYETQPRSLVADWARLLAEGDVDRAAALYAPDATIQTDEETIAGRRDIRRHLAASPLAGGSVQEVSGLEDGRFEIVWRAGDGQDRCATLRVEHGRVMEHTEGTPASKDTGRAAQQVLSLLHPPVQTAVVHGRVPSWAVAYAEAKVREVAAHAPAPVLFARVALAHEENAANARPAVAKATLDVHGQPVRAHVAAGTFTEAVDLMKDRLRRGLDALTARQHTRRLDTGDSGAGEWRHGDLPTDRPDYFPRPAGEREYVRHKSLAMRELTAEEAALTLDVLDLDWLLFTELHTGADAVIERVDSGYRLRVTGATMPPDDGLAVPVEVVDAVPTLRLVQATETLDVGGLPFVFFVEAGSDRGAVVYRRYDGHYGVVVPADAAPMSTT